MYRHGPPQRFGAQVVPVNHPFEDAVAAQELLEKLHAPAPATAPAEQQPQPKEAMPDPVLQGLLSLNPKDPQRRKERDALVSERIGANEQARALIEAELKENHDAIVQQHAECRARGRAQEKVMADLDTKIAECSQQITKSDDALAQALAELTSAQENLKALNRFSADEEIRKAEREIRKAEKRVKQTQARKAEWMQQRNHVILVECPPQEKLFSEIKAELTRLDALVTGRSADFAERSTLGFIT